MSDALSHAGADFVGGIVGYVLAFALMFVPPGYLLIKWPRVVVPLLVVAALVLIAANAFARDLDHVNGNAGALRCSDAEGFTVADWKVRNGRYRIRIAGEWSEVASDAVGPLLVMLQLTGTPCAIVKRAPK